MVEGLGKRKTADQRMVNYRGVSSVDEILPKIEKLGGKVLIPKTVVPGGGYLAICTDTENNTFGLGRMTKKLSNFKFAELSIFQNIN